jgi:hypothetical protein
VGSRVFVWVVDGVERGPGVVGSGDGDLGFNEMNLKMEMNLNLAGQASCADGGNVTLHPK